MRAACAECLRRAHALALVAPRIEGLLQRPRERIAQVLTLPELELLEALVPADRLAQTRGELDAFDPAGLRDATEEAGLRAICRHDGAYPELLGLQADAPPVLWIRGDPGRLTELLAGPAVAVVGSRRASPYGLEVAEQLSRGLAVAGVTVVSGLALGIDAAAHRGALDAPDPRTIAVLGSGADVPYPRNNRRLYDRIGEVGAVLSELPPGRQPFRWTFPARNRIMAALSAMTLVVEAADPSGSLITAAFAADIGRTVAAVPGRVTSSGAAGSNRLLRDGATVIRDAGDVLDELFGVGGAERLAAEALGAPELSGEQKDVLDAVETGSGSGEIAGSTGLDPSRVRAVLGQLEMAGAIKRTGIGSYERRAGRHP